MAAAVLGGRLIYGERCILGSVYGTGLFVHDRTASSGLSGISWPGGVTNALRRRDLWFLSLLGSSSSLDGLELLQ